METGPIRIGNSGTSRDGCSLQVVNLTHDEKEQLTGAMSHGSSWVRVDKEGGRLITHPVFAPFPDPVVDKEIHPFWRGPSDVEREMARQPTLFSFGDLHGSSPSFFISHLCGYNYTPERYKLQASRLKSYGFVEMRSERGDDGKFWNNWFLPGVWLARGELKKEVDRLKKDSALDDKQRCDQVVQFLCHNVQFGTLDLVVQRAAMVID